LYTASPGQTFHGDYVPQDVDHVTLTNFRICSRFSSKGKVRLFSRRQKSFDQQCPQTVEVLTDLPDGTVIDREIVALEDSARVRFNSLQNYRSEAHRIRYFAFDLLCYKNRDTTNLPLGERRQLLRRLKFQSSKIQLVDYFETSAANMVAAAKQQGLEGVIAKRRYSLYRPGRRNWHGNLSQIDAITLKRIANDKRMRLGENSAASAKAAIDSVFVQASEGRRWRTFAIAAELPCQSELILRSVVHMVVSR
jgi:hypothetical protein